MFESSGLNLGLAITAIVLAVGVLSGYSVFAFLGTYAATCHRINTGAFMGMIKKLIMANNIDRAIKLCNSEIGDTALSPLTSGAKMLLTRANKSADELGRRHREAVESIEPLRRRFERAYRQRPINFTLAFVPTMAVLVALAWAHWWAILPIVIVVTLTTIPCGVLQVSTKRALGHFDDAEVALTQLHNDLIARQEGRMGRG